MKMLKHTSVTAALLAAGAVSFAGSVGAVGVGGDGLGEALIYPYYTARGGNNTLLSVVNTSDKAKAVKVRFREAKNTEDVLDFNLFLSPYDVWTGAVTKNAAGDGARLVTTDTSCTMPAKSSWNNLGNGAYGVDFFNYAYNATDGGAAQGLDRTLEGYVEIIEMATIDTTSTYYSSILHDKGVPTCKTIPSTQIQPGSGITAPTGGLFGAATYLSVGNGATTSANAVALNAFGRNGTIETPDNVNPNLWTHNSTIAAVTTPSSVVVADFATTAPAGFVNAQATAAALMASNVYGEYAYSSDLSLATDWVITMPVKQPFVNRSTAVAPFTAVWDKVNKVACETVSLVDTDREEGRASGPGVGFSPKPPGASPNSLCYESNVISFGTAPSATAASTVLASANTLWYKGIQIAGKDGGWLDLSFTGANAVAGISAVRTTQVDLTNGAVSSGGLVTFTGLPVVGFAASGAKVTAAGSGVRDNYSASTTLTFKRKITGVN